MFLASPSCSIFYMFLIYTSFSLVHKYLFISFIIYVPYFFFYSWESVFLCGYIPNFVFKSLAERLPFTTSLPVISASTSLNNVKDMTRLLVEVINSNNNSDNSNSSNIASIIKIPDHLSRRLPVILRQLEAMKSSSRDGWQSLRLEDLIDLCNMRQMLYSDPLSKDTSKLTILSRCQSPQVNLREVWIWIV